MSIQTEWKIKQIKRLAELIELEDELNYKLSFVRDEKINLIACMSEDDFKKALELYHKKIGLEP